MAAIGGSLESMTLNGRNYAVPADAEVSYSLAGFTNEVMANGDGSARLVKTAMPFKVEGLTVEVDDLREDLQKLQAVANLNDFVALTLTFASGRTYQGTAQIEGELKASSKNATAEFTLAGTGAFTAQ